MPKTIELTGHLGQWQALIYWPKPGFTGPKNWHNTISTKFPHASRASGRALLIGLIGNRLANGIGPVLISQTVVQSVYCVTTISYKEVPRSVTQWFLSYCQIHFLESNNSLCCTSKQDQLCPVAVGMIGTSWPCHQEAERWVASGEQQQQPQS